MRKWFACLGVLGLAATAATAQTIPASISNFLISTAEDDGAAETSWKLNYPSSANEGFNVDFNTDAGVGANILGVSVQSYVSLGSAQNYKYIALCGDNLAVDPSGRTPNIGSPLSVLNNPTGGVAGLYCTGFTTFDLPDVAAGTSGIHAALAFPTGDTTTWLCTDMFDSAGANQTGPRHTFFTTDNYATPAAYPMTNFNWMIRLVHTPAVTNGGSFLVNGSLAATVGGGKTLALQFWSADNGATTKYLEVLDVGVLIPLPGLILNTGFSNFVAIPIQALGQLSGPAPCSAIGLTLTFRAFFADNLDLKKNGKKKIKLTPGATATFVSSGACAPNLCFGIKDDGVMDGFIGKIRSPAGSKDIVSETHGYVQNNGGLYGNPTVTNLTAVEETTWDFCGGSCWQEVGIYPANTVIDPSGNSPDIANPVASIGGTSACPGLGAYTGTWGFPATVYDTPDAVANSSTNYHTAFEMNNADSCLWFGLDSDGSDDDGGNDCFDKTAHAVGAYSFFSIDGYATPGTNWGGQNQMQRIDWN